MAKEIKKSPGRKRRRKAESGSSLGPEVLDSERSEHSVEVVEPGDEEGAVEVLPPEDHDHAGLPLDEDMDDEPESKGDRAPVPYDPLEAYLREISRFPHLTPQEEHELAVSYYKNKDRDAAYRLISSNLWLVVKIARDYERAARNLLDLIQEGSMGLMEAVKNFDPYRGVRFPSYAAWWVKAYIIRFLMANWRLVKLGTTQAQRKLFFNLRKERDRLEREGFYPGPKLLAEKLNVKESEVVEMEQRLGGADVSVDAPIQADSDSNLLSVIDSGMLSAEEMLARKESQALLVRSLEEFAATLNEKEVMIFRQRMLSEEKATLQELSDSLSLSKERVRQIENRLRDKLKVFLLERLGSSSESLDIEI